MEPTYASSLPSTSVGLIPVTKGLDREGRFWQGRPFPAELVKYRAFDPSLLKNEVVVGFFTIVYYL